MKINIIDPSSTEFNRGSFCYAPYLVYNGLSEKNLTQKEIHDVKLYEVFQPENLDNVRDADLHIVCLWSYPQIEACLLLATGLPFQYEKRNVYFVGYSPLIRQLGLPHVEEVLGYDPLQDSKFLQSAMKTYPKYYSHFHRLLLSDCDMHLKSLQKDDLVYPLFTTYGCPNGCSFCPSTINCGKKRIQLTVSETCDLLDECSIKGIRYIHFTDEDFFFNIKRVFSILDHIKGKGFHLIALGSAYKVLKFIETYGTDILKESGLEVIEIGFETAAVDISGDMGIGKDAAACLAIAERRRELPFEVFWLVLTYFPGETLNSLRKTGEFMRKYGQDKSAVVGRLKTNGTTGGLGQFFQPYDGLSIYEDLQGLKITSRPIRLIPSFIPDSFLDCVIEKVDLSYLLIEEVLLWFAVYQVSPDILYQIKPGDKIRDYFQGTVYSQISNAIRFALLARMGVIQ